MPDVMKTLLLNPPSFENFDGGASSRWPATREIESYWYPVWLTYPAGLIPGSRLLDASPHKVNWQQTVEICKDYEFLVLFTSTVGFRQRRQAAPQDQGSESLAEGRVCRASRPHQARRDAELQRRH